MPRTNVKAAAKSKQPIRSTRQFVEAEEHVAQERPRNMRSSGPARKSLESRHIEVVDKPVSKEKLENLAFMEEEITVLIHETTDKNDDPLPHVQNDGRGHYFIRGQEQRVKRKYVEVLARAKRTTYTQELVEHPEKHYKNIPHTALRFPFTVTEDSNPRGRAWLKALLAETQ